MLSRGVLLLVIMAVAAFSVPRGGAAPPAAAPGQQQGFDWATDAGSRALIEQSIAAARPEAQRLITEIASRTTIATGDTGPDALGTTQPENGHYLVTLNLGQTMHDLGPRGVERLVLHELGHVVDFALVPAPLKAQFDAGIPAGLPCPAGTPLGSCAPREERFAETFAKWAMFDDLGVSLYIGYAVPPPGSFQTWAQPLSAL
jgi:hypothetical protein